MKSKFKKEISPTVLFQASTPLTQSSTASNKDSSVKQNVKLVDNQQLPQQLKALELRDHHLRHLHRHHHHHHRDHQAVVPVMHQRQQVEQAATVVLKIQRRLKTANHPKRPSLISQKTLKVLPSLNSSTKRLV
jgi:hypothetical protein